ncbi:MAG: aminotransferase class V-fold PLP-dependent enzyme [Acidimicrobiales bacterium]|nr:aminotransferase class V-fold PLP-dependent enzyme [Acidimicrobiales bacterium]
MATTPLPRDQFPVAERHAYLNHAGVAPIPRCAADAAREVLDDFVHRGAVDMAAWEDRQEVVRASAARLLGVPVTDVAFVKNTSEGLGFVANGLEWRPGDRVLVPDREFPSTALPWLALRDRGVDVDLLEPVGPTWDLPLDVFAEALDRAPTRLVCVSWVQFARGWRTDIAALAELCHAHGSLLCVDAIQGLGLLPAELEAWGVDFAAADAHKWLLGPLGCGVLFVAERCRDLLRPLEPGWASVAHREQWENLELVYDDSARRFEGGSQTLMAIMAMGASIDLLLECDPLRIWPHVDGLCERITSGLEDLGASVLSTRDPAHRAGIVTFSLPGHDEGSQVDRLEAEGVIASPRGGGVRVSPHGYNDDGDVERLLEAVARLRRS